MTTAQDQQSRAEFEADWRTRHTPLTMNTRRHDDGRYGDPRIQSEWEAWIQGKWEALQAARALPAGMKPFGYVRRRNGKFYHEVEGLPAADFDVVYTAPGAGHGPRAARLAGSSGGG